YSVTGNAIGLLEGVTANYASGSTTWNVPLTLVLGQTFDTANAGATLVLGGTVDTGSLLTLTIDGSGTTQISATVTNSGGITKLGAGTLVLSGANDYLGLTQITQGIVNIQSNTALGDVSAGTNVNSGAALQVQGNITVGEALSITGNGFGIGL